MIIVISSVAIFRSGVSTDLNFYTEPLYTDILGIKYVQQTKHLKSNLKNLQRLEFKKQKNNWEGETEYVNSILLYGLNNKCYGFVFTRQECKTC